MRSRLQLIACLVAALAAGGAFAAPASHVSANRLRQAIVCLTGDRDDARVLSPVSTPSRPVPAGSVPGPVDSSRGPLAAAGLVRFQRPPPFLPLAHA